MEFIKEIDENDPKKGKPDVKKIDLQFHNLQMKSNSPSFDVSNTSRKLNADMEAVFKKKEQQIAIKKSHSNSSHALKTSMAQTLGMESADVKKSRNSNLKFENKSNPPVPMQSKFMGPRNHKNQLMQSALDHYYKTKDQANNFI